MSDAANSSWLALRAWRCCSVRWLRDSSCANESRVFERICTLSAQNAIHTTAAVTAPPSAASLTPSELRRVRRRSDAIADSIGVNARQLRPAAAGC